MRDLLLLVIAVLAVTGNAAADIHEIPTKCPESSGKTVQLAHKHDCTKFYECFNGQKQLSNCPEFAPGQKLHFDPELQNCTFPWEANCASRAPDCSTDEFIQPHPTNCSLYFKCENGEKVLKTCDVEQLFCSDSLECVHKDAAKCKVYNSCPTGKLLEAVLLPHHHQSLYYECVDGQYAVRRCPSGHVFDNEVRLCVSKVHCPATGIKRISHETDCSLYYECVDGVKVEKVCEDGLSFDETKGICTFSLSNECSSNFKQTDLATYFVPHVADGRDVVDCPPEGYTFIPHECSCTKYYSCEDGNKFVEKCPEGMMYDYIRKVCDLPHTAICKNQKYTDDIFLDPNCYNSTDCLPDSHARFPHNQCRLYYECHSGRKCLRVCSEGHVYNPNLHVCDLPKNVPRCGGGGSDEPDDTTPNNTDYDCTPCNNCHNCIVRFAYPENCNLYYQCVYGQKVRMQCPRNLVFDPINQICDYQENVHCTPTTTTTTMTTTTARSYCVEGQRKQHECQCQEYYECRNGRYQWFKCRSGTSFDWIILQCVAEDTAICYPDQKNDCEGTCSSGNSRLPHKECDKYCTCDGGTIRVRNCPSGLYYDKVSGACAWPENVDLKSRCPLITDCTRTSRTVPHNCKCELYYKCEEGNKYLAECPGASSFDYVLGYCVDKEPHCYHEYSKNGTVNYCIGYCPEQTSSSPIIRLEHRDCNKYCVCSMGAPYVVNCPSCSRYDSQRQACVSSNACNCNIGVKKSLWSDIPFVNKFL